jgi:hypothetical protein
VLGILDQTRCSSFDSLPDRNAGPALSVCTTAYGTHLSFIDLGYVRQFHTFQTDSSFLGQSSMVAERLRGIEKQDEASQAMLKTALKGTAAAAVAGA